MTGRSSLRFRYAFFGVATALTICSLGMFRAAVPHQIEGDDPLLALPVPGGTIAVSDSPDGGVEFVPTEPATIGDAEINARRRGACCLPDGTCRVMRERKCLQRGGVYAGDNVSCVNILCTPPEPTGACCVFPFGGPDLCLVTTAADCAAQNGIYQGDNTTCADGCPTVGACCTGDPANPQCSRETAAACAAQGGQYQGDGTACNVPFACPITVALGACCVSGPGPSLCFETSEQGCEDAGGSYQGDGSLCAGGCPTNIGACCIGFVTPNCTTTTEADCLAAGGNYVGDGTNCFNVLCPIIVPLGACCIDGPGGFDQCIETSEQQCLISGGDWQGAGTLCVLGCPFTGGPTGACCLPQFGDNCAEVTAFECAVLFSGIYQGDGTMCADTDCMNTK